MVKRLVVIFVLFIGLASGGVAQKDDEVLLLAQGQLVFDPGTDRAVLRSDRPGRLVVDAVIGGIDYSFLVDTGSPASYVLPEVVNALPNQFRQVPDHPHLRFVDHLHLGSLDLQDVPLFSGTEFDQTERRLHVDGTLGMNLLQRLYWEADLASLTVTFFQTPQPMSDPITLNPLYTLRLVVDGSIDGRRATWAIDTGWAQGYPVSALRRADLPPSTVFHSLVGTPRATNYMQDAAKDPQIGALHNVMIGPTKVPVMAFSLYWPRTEYLNDPSAFFNNTGIIPLEFFQGGKLLVDVPDGKISWHVSPKTMAPTSDPSLLYGMALNGEGSGLLKIAALDQQGWAYQNGLRLDDLIIAPSWELNGRPNLPFGSRDLTKDAHPVVSLNYVRGGVIHLLSARYFNGLLTSGP